MVPCRSTPIQLGYSTVTFGRFSKMATAGPALIILECLIWPGCILPAASGEDAMTAVLYTASDFPSLARGIDPGLAGEATVHVWSPSQDEWRLTATEGTLALHHKGGPRD